MAHYEELSPGIGARMADDLAHRRPSPYAFDEALKTKLNKLKNLILVLRDAESILGDCNVAVTVPAGEVKIPYALLLTRLNTMITLNLGEKKVDFHIRIEPTSADTFR